MIIIWIYNTQTYPCQGCSRHRFSQCTCTSWLKSSHILCKWGIIEMRFEFYFNTIYSFGSLRTVGSWGWGVEWGWGWGVGVGLGGGGGLGGGCCPIQLGLHSRMHNHHMISANRPALRGASCQLRTASRVGRMAVGDLNMIWDLTIHGLLDQQRGFEIHPTIWREPVQCGQCGYDMAESLQPGDHSTFQNSLNTAQ